MTTRARNKLLVAKDRAELRRWGAEVLARKIQMIAHSRGVCSIALSGGTTPGPIYEELGNSDLSEKIPWSRLEFYFADERAVPIDHPDSNYQLVKNTLLKSHPEAWGQMYRMPVESADRDSAAERYGRRLPNPLDILVLGMGPDGHIASLFPGSAALDETERRVVWVTNSPKPPPERMTITPVMIEKARSIIVFAAGVEKAVMVSRAIGGRADPKTIPAQLARRGTWVVDHAAAGNLLNP